MHMDAIFARAVGIRFTHNQLLKETHLFFQCILSDVYGPNIPKEILCSSLHMSAFDLMTYMQVM